MITKEDVIEALKTVKDPEVGFDIWSMGLVYAIEIKKSRNQSPPQRDPASWRRENKDVDEVKIVMTYTTPFCPWGPQLNDEVTTVLKDGLGVQKVDIEITFDPPYTMPEDLRATLGI